MDAPTDGRGPSRLVLTGLGKPDRHSNALPNSNKFVRGRSPPPPTNVPRRGALQAPEIPADATQRVWFEPDRNISSTSSAWIACGVLFMYLWLHLISICSSVSSCIFIVCFCCHVHQLGGQISPRAWCAFCSFLSSWAPRASFGCPDVAACVVCMLLVCCLVLSGCSLLPLICH